MLLPKAANSAGTVPGHSRDKFAGLLCFQTEDEHRLRGTNVTTPSPTRRRPLLSSPLPPPAEGRNLPLAAAGLSCFAWVSQGNHRKTQAPRSHTSTRFMHGAVLGTGARQHPGARLGTQVGTAWVAPRAAVRQRRGLCKAPFTVFLRLS